MEQAVAAIDEDNRNHCIVRPKEVAKLMGISRSTLYVLITDGKFPRPVHISSRARGWPRFVIDEYIASLMK
ncbi:helix-turn-helix transcriptional regulator [Burkholderia sola]|uniref:helix-turn-helix transcriptional regulator n=1 Tax=Burkholderia sola TaxID=2843302 RepID=UPI0023DD9997|nr:AlpA family phage regulatory protein [Burkholderia sola]MDF3086387.1 AlpA family phage regulatory protein [Burkholderia sola]